MSPLFLWLMCKFFLHKEFRHTECHKFTEHWKNVKQKIKQKGLVFFCTLEEDLCGVYTGEEGKKERRKGGRRDWSFRKNMEQESGWSVVMDFLCTPGMFFTVSSSVTSSSYPINLAKLLVRLKKKAYENNDLQVKLNRLPRSHWSHF